MWEVEYTDEFGQWWGELDEEEQVSVAASVELLRQMGPHCPGRMSIRLTAPDIPT